MPLSVFDNIPDEFLLTKVKQSDKEAFVAVYERYHKVLYVVSYRYLKEEGRAKDVVQDVFTTLWEKRESIQVNTRLKSYLYTMVRNRILNLIKREKRMVLSDWEDERETLADMDNLQPAIEDNHWQKSLYEAIDKLPKQKRLVCLLKVKEGLSNKEVAKKLNITEHTVKKHYTQSLARLRVLLKTC
ncbi:MAG: RNA polymerase sigma-70 factor [Bacteroidota bacterium]|jgi:RNA polymerase sigma-70 factor (ECF subfamily)|nr:RNA polymerase sigma-70 factor [Bacteroidota bacterium]HHU97101.1 RNA polymerase sigma-70 factor [Petrimonas sp.]